MTTINHNDYWHTQVTYNDGPNTTVIEREPIEDSQPPDRLPRSTRFTGAVRTATSTYPTATNYFEGDLPLGSKPDADLMSRVVGDPSSHESISYTMTPDSDEKAEKLVREIFEKEKSLWKKGLRNIKRTKTYHLTFVVNSLTNPGKLFSPAERKSLKDESAALFRLSKKPLQIGEFTVHLHPIHVHHNFNQLEEVLPYELQGKKLENKINAEGIKALIAYAKTKPNDARINAAIAQLEKPYDLTVSERLILIDFLAQLCDLPITHHCHTNVDHTAIATTVSMMNHFIKQGRLIRSFDQTTPIHSLLQNSEYKEKFISFLNINHQVARDANIGLLPSIGSTQRELSVLSCKKWVWKIVGANLFHSKILAIVYYALLILPTIGLLIYFKAKSGRIQKEFLKAIWLRPFKKHWGKLEDKLLGEPAFGLNLGSGVLRDAGVIPFFPESALKPTLLSRGRVTRYLAAALIPIACLIYYVALPFVTPFLKREDLKTLWTLPFKIRWRELKNIDFEKTFNLKSLEINGDGKHLLHGAECLIDPNDVDPRISLLPDDLIPSDYPLINH